MNPNSICNSCVSSGVCVIVKLSELYGVDSVTTSCREYHGQQTNATQPVVEVPRKARPVRKILEISENIKKLSESKPTVVLDNAEKEELCEVCGENPADSVCEECGKKICANCSTSDLGTSKEYCPDCWEKI